MTKIEWTERTWNPIVGCSIVSPGCTHCYAMGQAARLLDKPGHHYEGTTKRVNGRAVWTGKVALAPDRILLKPLKTRRPTMWFVNSMGDLFHEWVPDEWIDRVFAVMALCPQHVFQVLTKRSSRMRAYVENLPNRDDLVADALANNIRHRVRAPLPNVWLGISAERQQEADARIPDLLATPAAVRFVSAEPLLGPLNIRASLRPAQPFTYEDLPTTWDAFDWPNWVPVEVRGLIQDFWSERYGRGPRAWLRDAITQGGPALWSAAKLLRLTHSEEWVSGRFVHCWSNIGLVVHDDGSVTQGYFTARSVYTAVVEAGKGLDWVIVGGESGPGARPMHPDWARAIRDQCLAAGVPFFFKQWGEWGPVPRREDLPGRPQMVRAGDLFISLSGGSGSILYRAAQVRAEAVGFMRRLGKARAGRLLDGREWNEMPAVRPAAAEVACHG